MKRWQVFTGIVVLAAAVTSYACLSGHEWTKYVAVAMYTVPFLLLPFAGAIESKWLRAKPAAEQEGKYVAVIIFFVAIILFVLGIVAMNVLTKLGVLSGA